MKVIKSASMNGLFKMREVINMASIAEYDIYRKVKRELLIEDIKSKAIEMDIDLTGIDLDRLADHAENAIDNNDSMWESYWMSVEYAFERI